MEIRRLIPADYDGYYAVRLAGLEECPAAFATDAAAWKTAPRDAIERLLKLSQERKDMAIMGAWIDDQVVGTIAMKRDLRPSVMHKTSLLGFYVYPSYRRQGIGQALLTEFIALAQDIPDLLQIRTIANLSCTEALSLFKKVGFERFGLEPKAKKVDNTFYDQIYLWYSLFDK